jgi:hypothetical protein
LEDLTTIHTDTDSSFNEKLKLNAGSKLIIVAITEVKLDFQIRGSEMNTPKYELFMVCNQLIEVLQCIIA